MAITEFGMLPPLSICLTGECISGKIKDVHAASQTHFLSSLFGILSDFARVG
jgi:hypothetical protein